MHKRVRIYSDAGNDRLHAQLENWARDMDRHAKPVKCIVVLEPCEAVAKPLYRSQLGKAGTGYQRDAISGGAAREVRFPNGIAVFVCGGRAVPQVRTVYEVPVPE